MKPFETMTEAIAWWKDNCGVGGSVQKFRLCSLLLDVRSVGFGIQRREVVRSVNGSYIMGFSGVSRHA